MHWESCKTNCLGTLPATNAPSFFHWYVSLSLFDVMKSIWLNAERLLNSLSIAWSNAAFNTWVWVHFWNISKRKYSKLECLWGVCVFYLGRKSHCIQWALLWCKHVLDWSVGMLLDRKQKILKGWFNSHVLGFFFSWKIFEEQPASIVHFTSSSWEEVIL